MKTFVLAILIIFVYLGGIVTGEVIERNVMTGEVITRPYTQKELDNIEASKPTQIELDKQNLAELRQKALVAEKEKMLMSGTSLEAIAYQEAKGQ